MKSLEILISHMMTMNILARLWHWRTDSAQHHKTYENFLNANEELVDRLVESALGNDVTLSFAKIGVQEALENNYSLEGAIKKIKHYRSEISKAQSQLSSDSFQGNSEMAAILDDAIEQASKTLYLLKLQ